MPERALDGLRVVDISQGIAGPYATKLLADAGALVTKVEPPAGDYSRRLGPFPGDVPDPGDVVGAVRGGALASARRRAGGSEVEKAGGYACCTVKKLLDL